MRKIRLDVDRLKVESFPTTGGGRTGGGTVHGHSGVPCGTLYCHQTEGCQANTSIGADGACICVPHVDPSDDTC